RQGDSAVCFRGMLGAAREIGCEPGGCGVGNSRTKHAWARPRRGVHAAQKSPGTARGPGPKRVGLPILPATPGSPYEPWALTRSGLAARRERPCGSRRRLAGGGLAGRGLLRRGLPGGRLAGRALLGRGLLGRRLGGRGLLRRGLLRRRLARRGLLRRGLLRRRLASRGLLRRGLLRRRLAGRGLLRRGLLRRRLASRGLL